MRSGCSHRYQPSHSRVIHCCCGDTMTPLSGLFFALILLVDSSVADSVKAIVGDQLKVPVNCEPGESVTLQRVMLHGPRDVATDQSGQWKVSRKEDRGRIELDSYIVFTRTFYTDEGTYEVTCSKSGTKETIQVKVVLASKVSVTRGDTVTLPCYGRTKEGKGLPGRWEKNGKPLCVKNSYKGCSGTPADGLTVSTDWITNGDLSLTIEGVQPEDGGVYFCYIKDGEESKSGTPAAVRLTVTEKMTHQMISSTAAPGNQTQSSAELTRPWQISTWVLLVILVALLVLLLCLWRSGKIRCDSGKVYEAVNGNFNASNSGEATTMNKLDGSVSYVEVSV
ncbi:uncharacterized protein LOC122820577 [Gambusia affinis]|uniref:uncharacterized protein LOC122820577 n=1 Tax=Gambusia affinis TaxID=33528 RepID=UPI001CDB7E04|nr:uncharacterized protein LOC122820577 [Gambusia affinis]